MDKKIYSNTCYGPDGCTLPGHHHPAPCDVDCPPCPCEPSCGPFAPVPPPCPGEPSCGPFSPVPPPIAPLMPVPGYNPQQQMSFVVNKTNECINRWNYIQQNCYEALNKMVGAAICNDVYYDRDEVCFESGYNATDESAYHIIRIKCVDKAGQPIRMKLALAYGNTTNSNLKQSIQDVSFLTDANAIITAVDPGLVGWKGTTVYQGAPITGTADTGGYVAGFNRAGALKVFSSNVDATTLCQNQMEDCIGFATPIIQDGEITTQAQGLTTKGAVSAIGYISGNGEKIFFQCGNMDNPGMQGITVANLLKDMGCTTAVITSIITNASATYSNGMMYMGCLSDAPTQWNIPENAAYWVVSKRPFCGWRNKFTSEIAQLVQKVGQNWNATMANEYKIEQVMDAVEIANEAKELAQKALDEIAEINTELDEIQEHLTTHDTQIKELQDGLAAETAAREAADEQLQTNIDNEAAARELADTQLETKIETETAERTAADAVLQGNINQEAIDRANADLQIQQNLATEIANRTQADQTLQDQIHDIVNGDTGLAYVKLAGDTMTGPLILSGDATQPLQAVTFRQLPDPYTLPIASAQTLGGIRVGANLEITPEGVLNATTGGGSADYTAGAGIIISGTEISIDTEYFTAHPELMPYLLLSGGTMAGNIVMGTHQIKGLANGVDTNDAVNMSQLTAVSNEVTALEQTVTNITSGTTELPYLKLTGGTMTGPIEMGENKISGVANATDSHDAVNFAQLTIIGDQVTTLQNTVNGITSGTTNLPYLKLSGGTVTGNVTFTQGTASATLTRTRTTPIDKMGFTSQQSFTFDTNGFEVSSPGDGVVFYGSNIRLNTVSGTNVEINSTGVDVNGAQIKMLADPTDEQDAVNLRTLNKVSGEDYTGSSNTVTINGPSVSGDLVPITITATDTTITKAVFDKYTLYIEIGDTSVAWTINISIPEEYTFFNPLMRTNKGGREDNVLTEVSDHELSFGRTAGSPTNSAWVISGMSSGTSNYSYLCALIK